MIPQPGLEARAFARLDTLADLSGPVFLVGLSGGGDSTALMEITRLWAARKGAGSGIRVSACIVDHGLRAGSAEAAQAVAEGWQARGAAVQVRRWERGSASASLTSAAPASQAAARAARHGILADAARACGAGTILLAHTSDDQAETLAMRLIKATGPDGLAGMAQLSQSPADPLPGAALVARPLLDASRQDLRDWLVARGLSWIEDPANREHRFTRVAVRSRLAALTQAGPDPARRLLAISALAAQLRQRIDADALILAAQAASVPGDHLIFPQLAAFPVGPALVRAMGWAVAVAGSRTPASTARPVDPQRLAQALRQAIGGRAANLGGALIRRQADSLLVMPEPRRRSRVSAPEPEPGLLDDRWRARLLAVRASLAMEAAHPPMAP